MSKERYRNVACPHCEETVEIESGGDAETMNDWMEEAGWYKTAKRRYVCPDCYEEGKR